MHRSFGNSSFESYCRDMERTRTLTFWSKKNDLPPDGVSEHGWKTVYMKCPDCGNEWTEELQVLMNVNFSEDWCPVCAKKKRNAEPKKKGHRKKAPRAIRPRVVPPEISNCVAVIDVETTWHDEVMSIGAVIVDTRDKYRILDVAYWLVSPFCYQPAMFSGAIELSMVKESSFFYQKGNCILDSVTETEDTFENCIAGLKALLDRYYVSSCFAYNGHFDKRHLLDLDGVVWFDLVVPFTSYDLNPYLSSEKIPGENLGFGKAGVRLVKEYSFFDIMRHIPGCKRYRETHNGCVDAFEEAMAMQMMKLPRDEYRIGWLRDTKVEKERRAEAEARRSVLQIPFSETIAMSYSEYVDYLRAKYGKVKDDYFVIMPEEKWLSWEYDVYRYRYCGDYVLRDGDKYPVSGTNYRSYFAEDGIGDIYDDKTYWYSPEGKFFICWGRKGEYSRTPEGLLCHHVDEDKASVLSNPYFAKDYPFSYQRRERLVYCDYVEHLLLHYKIKGEDCSGFDVIAEEIRQFLHGNIPYDWQIMCVRRMLQRLNDLRTLRSEGILDLDEEI